MRIVQIVLAGAPAYELKCQRVDFSALAVGHSVVSPQIPVPSPQGDLAHVYGPSPLPPIDLSIPYVASSAPQARRFSFRKIVSPRAIVAWPEVPEAVEENYFAPNAKPGDWGLRTGDFRIGSFKRANTLDFVERTMARIHRFRDDVQWHVFDRVPTPDDLAGVDVWVDPAIDENDLDGFVAEALVSGKPVVASRTAINSWRLENGRAGFLVPRNDANELTHAILAALFKAEQRDSKIEAAGQTAGKFRPRQRLRILERIYETVIR